MIAFLTYIVETAISVSVFYIFYELFLKRDTWFRFNRYYLLFGIIFSFILPLLDFSASSVVVNSQNQFEFNEYINLGSTISSFKEQTVESISNLNYLMLVYLIIGSVFFVRILYQLFKILKTVNANEIIKYRNRKLVLMNNNSSPFSFYNYIFISKDDYGSIGSNELLLHEFTHAKQMHSIDVILLELILVLQWFNPFIYRYRLAFKEVHEYLADRGVLMAKNNKIAYQKLILDQIEKSFSVNLASQFNYSLTKNRIKMMTRIKSGKLSKFKTLLVLPLIAILLMAFSINTSKEINIKTNQTKSQSNSTPSIFPVKKFEGVIISSSFGMRIHPISKKEMMHNAVDIKAPEGTPVYATADGLVRKVQKNFKQGKGHGKYIIIDHEGGFSTMYTQLFAYNVKEGQKVKKGDEIGNVGSTGISTGPHLHYEVKKDGENVDPEKYF
jgi:bla regulator protein blaR1